jgi:hypothetical protein
MNAAQSTNTETRNNIEFRIAKGSKQKTIHLPPAAGQLRLGGCTHTKMVTGYEWRVKKRENGAMNRTLPELDTAKPFDWFGWLTTRQLGVGWVCHEESGCRRHAAMRSWAELGCFTWNIANLSGFLWQV